MTNDEKLMQQALEALEVWKDYYAAHWDKSDEQAITALRERLAQPEQEPVAEVYRAHYGGNARNIGIDSVRQLPGVVLPPPGTKLYTSPPASKPWVGLTDEEIRRIELSVHGYTRQALDIKAFARAIAAELKEKNA